MPIFTITAPSVDAAPVNIDDGSVRLRNIRIASGYTPPFWLRFDRDDNKVHSVIALPFHVVAVAGVVEVLSTDPNLGELTVSLTVHRVDGGSGSVLVSNGILLRPGDLQPGQTNNVRVLADGVEQDIYIEELEGRHSDGSLRSVLVQFNHVVNSGMDLVGELLGQARNTGNDITKTTPPSEPAAVALPSDAAYLIATELIGPLNTKASIPASPTQLQSWQSNLESFGDVRFVQDASLVDPPHGSVQYDRALGWFTHWLRSGNVKWFDRAVNWALAYRNDEAPDFKPPAHNNSMDGIALHYLLTGNTVSRTAALESASRNRDTWGPRLGDNSDTFMNGRIQSKTLLGAIYGHLLDPTAGWDTTATSYITPILGTQGADGSFKFGESCSTPSDCHQSFMVGMCMQALITYHTLISADSRIPTTVLDAMTYLWNTEWLPGSRAFRYRSVDFCEGSAGNLNPTPDLNSYQALPFYWLYVQTGDTLWRDRGDEILSGTVDLAWWGDPSPGTGSKQYNQQIMTIGQALYWRQQQ